MKANKRIITGIAISALIFIFIATMTPGRTVNAVNQAELEEQVKRAISYFGGNPEILRDILFDRFNTLENEGFINEYFENSEFVDIRISEEGSVDVVNDNEIVVYTYLLVDLDTGGSGVREVETEITVMLEKVNQDWTIDRWELGHRSKADKRPDNQYRNDYDRLLDDIFNAILSYNTNSLYDSLDSDFEYEGPSFDGSRREEELDKGEFISRLDEIFAEGRYFSTFRLDDRSYDVDDDEVELEGVLTMVGRNSDESRFINHEYYVELEFEKKNGYWYLKEWETD